MSSTDVYPSYMPANEVLGHALSFVRAIPSLKKEGYPVLVYFKEAKPGFGCRGLPSDAEKTKEYVEQIRPHFEDFTEDQLRHATAFGLLVRCLIGTAKLWLQHPSKPDPKYAGSLSPGRREVLDPTALLRLNEEDFGNLASLEKMEGFLRNISFVEISSDSSAWSTDKCTESCAELQHSWLNSTRVADETIEL